MNTQIVPNSGEKLIENSNEELKGHFSIFFYSSYFIWIVNLFTSHFNLINWWISSYSVHDWEKTLEISVLRLVYERRSFGLLLLVCGLKFDRFWTLLFWWTQIAILIPSQPRRERRKVSTSRFIPSSTQWISGNWAEEVEEKELKNTNRIISIKRRIKVRIVFVSRWQRESRESIWTCYLSPC